MTMKEEVGLEMSLPPMYANDTATCCPLPSVCSEILPLVELIT